ncbi:cell division protein FtsL [Pantoea sp. Nvir]|uniref:cell division protein FtsL n=1 Tax=Pantoea sp. Nvir TaxID=2576760 RepID=UPI001358A45B|nr:cell division protein FtsL [Pantoea sp. Nvir]MXP66844.1 cell division protein FtsL [Pantoea sp. Nvir]CAJ0991241.1 Cell division protein FtsL [Pantoea sp. Nvir]
MIGNRIHSLPCLIGGDLLRYGKIPVILLIVVLVSAVIVVTITHETRLLTAQYERLILECDALDIEWRNLILEENALGNHSWVEHFATEKLQLQPVDPSQENILIQKEEILNRHERRK